MTYFSELWFIIKALFVFKPSDQDSLIVKKMNNFPFSGYKAMMWCGYYICRDENKITDVDMNHESIHLRQAQDEGAWIKFYWKYLKDYIKGNPLTKTSSVYRTIVYEIEAYAKQDDFSYLDRRPANYVENFRIPNSQRKKFDDEVRVVDGKRLSFADGCSNYFKDL